MTQLPLFAADAEASRRLQEAYDLLRADYETVLARLDRAKVAFRTLRQARDQLLQERDSLHHARDQARLEARHWHSLYEISRLLAPTPTPTLEPTLKQLLRLVHPDRWSQGQPATELAHELAVTINGLRAQGEGRP